MLAANLLTVASESRGYAPPPAQPFKKAKFQNRIGSNFLQPIDVVPTHDVLHYATTDPDWFDYVLCSDGGGSSLNVAVAEAANALALHGLPFSQVGNTRSNCATDPQQAPLFDSLICDPATGRCEANDEHLIYFIDDANSPTYSTFVKYVQQTMNANPVTTAGVGVALELRRKQDAPYQGTVHEASWMMFINAANYTASLEHPANTDVYAISQASYAPEVVLHELMHVTGAAHTSASDAASAGYGSSFSTIMAPRCSGSPGFRGATFGADTLSWPTTNQPGSLSLPAGEAKFIQDHFSAAGFPSTSYTRQLSTWVPVYDSTHDCVRYEPISELSEFPVPGVLSACPGQPLDGDDLEWVPYHGPIVDFHDPSGTYGVPAVDYRVRADSGGGDYGGGTSVTPRHATGFFNLRRNGYLNPNLVLDASAPLLAPGTTSTPWRLFAELDGVEVPMDVAVTRPRACPDPMNWQGPGPNPYLPCCTEAGE